MSIGTNLLPHQSSSSHTWTGGFSPGISAKDGRGVSRFEAGEHAHLLLRLHQTDRLRIRQTRPRSHVDALRHAGIHRPGDSTEQRLQQIRRLVGPRRPHLRNDGGVRTIFGWRGIHALFHG